MCLSSVSRKNLKSSIIHSGYKEFPNGEFQAYPMKAGRKVPKDKWIKAEGPASISANDGQYYPAFFHIYEEEDNNRRKGKRTRVFFRKLVCIGDQTGEPCYIAEEMYVPSDPNGWPPVEKKLSPTSKDSPMKVIIEKLSSVIDDIKKTAGNA